MELVLGFLGMGTGELVLVLLLVLVLFGADRVPDLARALGRAQARFASARNEIVETLEIERAGMTREQVEADKLRESHMRAQVESDKSEGGIHPGDGQSERAPSGDKPPG